MYGLASDATVPHDKPDMNSTWSRHVRRGRRPTWLAGPDTKGKV